MAKEEQKIYVYGRVVTSTPEEIEALEAPEGLTPWAEKENATKEGLVNSSEVFFAIKELTDDEIARMGVIDLGSVCLQHFYMSEKINGQYVTYVTGDPTGPGMLLYPVTWEDAKIYIFRTVKGGRCFQWPLSQIKSVTSNPDSLLCTRELALEYGVGLNNPYQDPKYSKIVKAIFTHLESKANTSNILPTDRIETKQGL